jgi:hypothetical protein
LAGVDPGKGYHLETMVIAEEILCDQSRLEFKAESKKIGK